jgi:hypothetical protein
VRKGSLLGIGIILWCLAPRPLQRCLDCLMACGFAQVLVLFHIEAALEVLRPDECEHDDIQVHASHKDTHDQSVLIPRDIFQRGQRETITEGGLDGRRSRGGQIPELVRSTDDESAERSRAQLHQVDRDNAPRALDTELLEEGCGHKCVGGGKRIGVQQGAANDGDEDDAEAAAEDLRAVTDNGAAGHGSQISDDLGDGDGVGGEIVLVGEECRVEIL